MVVLYNLYKNSSAAVSFLRCTLDTPPITPTLLEAAAAAAAAARPASCGRYSYEVVIVTFSLSSPTAVTSVTGSGG